MEAPTLFALPVLDAALPKAPVAACPYSVPTLRPTILTSRLKKRLLGGLFALVEAGLLVRFLRSPAKARQALKQLQVLRRQYFGEFVPQKMACVDGRYYRGYHSPGWPSAAYTSYVATAINRIVPFRPAPAATLNMVFLAITKKCPLACEHCFEWEALNQKEKLTLADLHALVATFQQKNVTQIFFSGGEPMLRIHDLVPVIAAAQPGTDFWVITSGFNFTFENARKLKQAGLTGVSISLDHYLPERHNTFRGSEKAFENAMQAATFAQEVGLVVNLAVCVTREFTTEDNLLKYAQLARQLGVAFIQLLEPRAVGHYAAQDVALSGAQTALLDEFYEQLNFDPAYHDWPMVTYYGYHQRRLGCSGAADRFLYVDTDGDMHACPFCQKKSGSALACASLDESLGQVRSNGCQLFHPSSI
ncbi:radical SAM protein [Hymenobacter jejuensis]|uniref:Radical SAM protein n=1 Tax=Hymenobacter jejuensis TaxID=2502781 RepID=A0A5B8A362_9BACT|nr:radical SAM protein [Hymenobacter jejuensis]QDA61740.1 radical SAM protein [Hymenobacter jejuensis]